MKAIRPLRYRETICGLWEGPFRLTLKDIFFGNVGRITFGGIKALFSNVSRFALAQGPAINKILKEAICPERLATCVYDAMCVEDTLTLSYRFRKLQRTIFITCYNVAAFL